MGFDKLPDDLNKLLKGTFTYPDLIEVIKKFFPQGKLDINAVPFKEFVGPNNQFNIPGFVGSYFKLRLAKPDVMTTNPFRGLFYIPQLVHLVPSLPAGALSGSPDHPVFPMQFPQGYDEPVLICDHPNSSESAPRSQ